MKKNIIIGILCMIILALGCTIFIVVKDKNEKKEMEAKLEAKREKKILEETENIIKNKDLEINQAEVTTENDFVNYLDDVANEVDRITLNENSSQKDKNILKNTFITLTDFIFYDGEIKGKKFSELTASCKEKVIDIYTKIDNKIENKFPNYKENIKSTSKKVYNNVKEKALDIKTKIQNEYRERVGDEGYKNTVDAYNEDKSNVKNVYDTYKPYIDEGKSKAKSAYESAKEKAANWYQNYKES